MIKLNLLPAKVRASERLRLLLLLGVIVYLLAGVGLGLRYTQARARVEEAQKAVDAVYAELNSPALISTVQAVEKFTKDKADEQAKAGVVSNYRRQQATLPRLLDSLPDWTLDGAVWFDHLKFEAAKSQATLEGSTLTPLDFARFYALVESQPIVSKLNLTAKPTLAVLKGKNVTHFIIAFNVETVK